MRSLLQQGRRPLNLTTQRGEQVRLVLQDPTGAWSGNPPGLELRLR